LASTKRVPDAFFDEDATTKMKFKGALAIVGVALGSFCSLLQIRRVGRWVLTMAASSRISPMWWSAARIRIWFEVAFARKVDFHSRRVRELATKKRLHRAQVLLQGVFSVSCFSVMHEARNQWIGRSSATPDLMSVTWFSNLFILLFNLLHQLNIQDISPLYLDTVNVSLSSIFVLQYFHQAYLRGSRQSRFYKSADDYWGYADAAILMLTMRLVLGFVCGNAKLSIVLNTIMTAVDLYARSVADPEFLRHYIMTQIAGLFVFSLIYWWDEKQSLAEAAALVDAETSDSKYLLAERVLEATCDAVVYLDDDLSLLGACPKLAEILLKHPKVACEGCSFLDFLSQDHDDDDATDVDRVRRLMEEEARRASRDPTKLDPAGTVHLDMVDAYQNKVPVQLYWCCAAQGEGRVRHLVGISKHAEVGEQDAEVSQRQRGTDTQLISVQEGMTMSFASHMESSCRPASITSSQRSVSSAESEGEGFKFADEEISVRVDAASRTLTLLWCSNAFLLLSGSYGPGSSLSEWLQGETDSCTSWLSSSTSHNRSSKVVLHPPGLQGAFYKARCRRRVAAADDASTDAVELVFDRLKFRTKATTGRRKSRHRRQPPSPPLDSTSVKVGLPSGKIIGVDFVFGCTAPQFFCSAFKVGRSIGECVVNRSAFTIVLRDSMEKMLHGKLDDSASVDLGIWDVTAEPCGTHSVQFILACLTAPSSEEEPDSVVCQLDVRIRPRAAREGVALGPAHEAKTGPWTTLGVDETEGASHDAVAIAACSLQGRSLQRL